MGVHPLTPLTAAEVGAASDAVRAHAASLSLPGRLRFNTVTLQEPPKRELLAFNAGGPCPARLALAVVTSSANADVVEARVELHDSQPPVVVNWLVLDGDALDGQPLATPDDCKLAEDIVRRSPEIAALLQERGIEASTLFLDPWAVHSPPKWVQRGTRLMQVFTYLRLVPGDNEYAHPLDIVPWVDLATETLLRVEQSANPPPPPTGANGNYRAALQDAVPWRTGLKPLHVVQPEGPSFSVDGWAVAWQRWRMRLGFNSREGLVLYDVAYEDPQEGRTRPVMHRGSIVEMAVPYGDPRPPYNRKCALDAGDYGLGFAANSLALGCDCLGHVHYFDGVVNDSRGSAVVIKNAVCMHEEDVGLLWKHVDYRTGHSESRRARRLVLSFIMTAINYEYAFYWYFGLDGKVEHEVKLTGLLSTSPLSADEPPGAPTHGTLVSPGVNAQHHQHFFAARLDLSVDDTAGGGAACYVSEVDAVIDPPSDDPEATSNGFSAMETVLKSTHAAMRVSAPEKARFWKVNNPSFRHRVTGAPVAYALVPGATARMLARPTSAVARRAYFVTRNLWVTPHADDQLYPAGMYCMQSRACSGLAKWTAEDVSLEGASPVLWYCFGVTHIVRPEDWPIMPCEHAGFALKPWGFFHVTPSVDVPPETDARSVLHAASPHGCGCA